MLDSGSCLGIGILEFKRAMVATSYTDNTRRSSYSKTEDVSKAVCWMYARLMGALRWLLDLDHELDFWPYFTQSYHGNPNSLQQLAQVISVQWSMATNAIKTAIIHWWGESQTSLMWSWTAQAVIPAVKSETSSLRWWRVFLSHLASMLGWWFANELYNNIKALDRDTGIFVHVYGMCR